MSEETDIIVNNLSISLSAVVRLFKAVLTFFEASVRQTFQLVFLETSVSQNYRISIFNYGKMSLFYLFLMVKVWCLLQFQVSINFLCFSFPTLLVKSWCSLWLFISLPCIFSLLKCLCFIYWSEHSFLFIDSYVPIYFTSEN